MLDLMAEPANCKECTATCPLKSTGCPYDLAQAGLELRTRLQGLGIPLAVDEAIQALGEKAAACRLQVVERVREENTETRMAARILAKLMAMAPGLKMPTEAPTGATVEGPVEPEERRSRGNPELYVNPGDQALEEDLLATADVHGVCTHPKIRIAKAQETIQALQPIFSQEPFQGLVAAIVKRHEPDGELGRITVYYRGPPPGEAQRILREKKG